jgi:hypothetical protein
MHLPGNADCTPVSVACPSDGWPAALPADRPIVYVDAAASAGGNGSSRSSPLRAIGSALVSSPTNAIIAVRVGTYDEATLVVTDARELRGACAAGTVLTTSAPGSVSVTLAGGGCALRDVTIDHPERAGIFVQAHDVSIAGVVVRGAIGTGIAATYGSAMITSVHVTGTRAGATSGVDRGIHVEGASIVLADVVIDTAHGTGLFGGGAGTSIDASDLAVWGMLPEADGTLGRGIECRLGASVSVTRGVIEDVLDMGATASDAGSALVLHDVVVRRTMAERASMSFGRGVDVEAGASGTLARTWISANTEAGMFVNGAGSTIDASDVIIGDTAPRPSDGKRGRGIDASSAGVITSARTVVANSTEMGVFVTDSAMVTATDLVIDRVASRPADHNFGVGAWADRGGSLRITRARITHLQLGGVVSIDHGMIDLADATVRGVDPPDCAATCPEFDGAGHALASFYGSTLHAARFDAGDAALCGALVGADHPDGTPTAMDLSDGTVSTAPVGACLQVIGFDPERLHHRVLYVDVAVPLQATSYPLPTLQ